MLVPIFPVGCLSPCGNRVLADVPSPLGTKHAVVFERDCGATTDFSTQLSILNAGDKLENEGGNAFVADSDHGRGTSLYVHVKWSTEGALTVNYPERARVFHNERQVNGVSITYKPDGY
jgi:hypothetical protein